MPRCPALRVVVRNGAVLRPRGIFLRKEVGLEAAVNCGFLSSDFGAVGTYGCCARKHLRPQHITRLSRLLEETALRNGNFHLTDMVEIVN